MNARWWSIAAGSLALFLAAGPAAAQQARETLVARGGTVFQAQGCYGCHTVGKTGTPIATDLSRVGAKYTESFLTRWLRDPSAQKPTAHMPKLELSDAEVQALAAFLASLRGE
jgi:mono/diheme cytochrome c family protein